VKLAQTFSNKVDDISYHCIDRSCAWLGTGAGTSTRRDLAAHFVRLSAEIANYAEDGRNIMIQNAVAGLTSYALGLSTALRLDVRQFYSQAYHGASELYHSTLEMMNSKGLLERAPTIPLPVKAEFVHKQVFWLVGSVTIAQ
jgi:hypothetical protein